MAVVSSIDSILPMFLAQGVYRLQYKHPAKASMVIMLHIAIYVCAELSSRPIAGIQLHVRSASYLLLSPLTACLEWLYSYSYLSTPLAIYFSLNIHNTHSS